MRPMRVLEGNAQPYEPFWKLRNAAEAESGEPEIELYGPISEFSWWGDEITPKKFKDDLNKLGGGGPVTIRINSGGGEVFAASVIRSIIVEYPGKVTCRIDGLCASAATFVAMAGNVVRMQDTGYFMIHDPSMVAWGTIDDIKQALDLLKTIKSGLVDVYQARTKLETEKLSRMMSDETWLTANEAKELGFVDEVIGTTSKKSLANLAGKSAIVNAVSYYKHVPEALRALLGEAEQPVNQAAAESADLKRLRAEVQFYVKER